MTAMAAAVMPNEIAMSLSIVFTPHRAVVEGSASHFLLPATGSIDPENDDLKGHNGPSTQQEGQHAHL